MENKCVVVFEDKGNFFDKTTYFENDDIVNKTRIIIQGCAMKSGEASFEIIRFFGSRKVGNWSLATNPYAGISLTKEQWKLIFERIASLSV